MKHTVLALIMLVTLPFMSNAQNKLRLENNTDNDVYAAYSMYSAPNKCWDCVGWFKVPKHNSIFLDLGNYTGQLYVHGENRSLTAIRNWGEGDMLCVDEKDAFEILCPRVVNCKVQKMFSLIPFQNGINNFTFNP